VKLNLEYFFKSDSLRCFYARCFYWGGGVFYILHLVGSLPQPTSSGGVVAYQRLRDDTEPWLRHRQSADAVQVAAIAVATTGTIYTVATTARQIYAI